MATGGIKVHVYGDYDDKDIKRAHRDLDALGNQSGATSDKFGMLSKAFAGAAIAAGAMAVKFGIDGVQAAIDDEAAAARLATTMRNVGLAHDTGQVETMIDALQRETGIADDQLRPAFGRLVTSLGDTGKATDALKLAMDISAGTGKSLEAVVAALGKAYDGNTGGLSRLGAGIDTAILKTGNMDTITAALAARFSGQAATAAGTYQGQINRMGIAFDELKESFGYGFLAGLQGAEGGVGDLTKAINGLGPSMKTAGEQIGAAIKTVSDLFSIVTDAKGAWDSWMTSLGSTGEAINTAIAFVAKMAGPVTRLIEMYNAVHDAYVRAFQVSATASGPGDVSLLKPKNQSSPAYTSQVPAKARAIGGPVSSGMPYVVGEKGPELFVPSVSGSIIPNGSTSLSGPSVAGAGGNSYNITVQAGVGDPRQIGQQVVEYIKRYEQANGKVWQAA